MGTLFRGEIQMSELKVNEYDVVLLKAVDGDTVDVDIDLGFGIWLRDERVRIMGIDTPESRTSDKVEKVFGLAAKKRLKELLENGAVLVTTEDKSGEDMKGKFGRILGDFKTPDGKLVTDVLVEEGHCVPYFGGSKDDVQAQHMKNRQRLLEEGVVDRAEYEEAVKLMEGK
jgi:micrococcal nuclease